MSGTVKTPIISTDDGYLPEFHIAYQSARMVLWTGPDIRFRGLSLRPSEEAIGALYKLKDDVGYFFVDLARQWRDVRDVP